MVEKLWLKHQFHISHGQLFISNIPRINRSFFFTKTGFSIEMNNIIKLELCI